MVSPHSPYLPRDRANVPGILEDDESTSMPQYRPMIALGNGIS